MAEFFPALTDAHRVFIARQPMFFVATAATDGRINISPKGLDSFRVVAADRVAYLDLGGSGNETQAHLSVDGRITIMFCAFDNPALILRLYGRGRSVPPEMPLSNRWPPYFPDCRAGGRSSTSRSRACRPRAAGRYLE